MKIGEVRARGPMAKEVKVESDKICAHFNAPEVEVFQFDSDLEAEDDPDQRRGTGSFLEDGRAHAARFREMLRRVRGLRCDIRPEWSFSRRKKTGRFRDTADFVPA